MRINRIKYLVMDVDGTLTDGKVYIGNSGEIMKAFSIKDGYGILDIAIPAGIAPVVITGRNSKIVENRCKELGIELVFQGIKDKLSILRSITDDLSIVAYIGDDLNDLPSMQAVKADGGIVGCPKNAEDDIIRNADFVSSFKGGNGAVREFIKWLIDREQSIQEYEFNRN